MDMGFGFGYGLFGIMQIIIPLFFLLVMGLVVVSIVKSILEWNKNNHSPRLTVPATVVTKRTQVGRRHHHHANGHTHSSSYTHYYVTFQVESGDRMEFQVDGSEYGMLVEGDVGQVSFQGTRYLGFVESRFHNSGF